MKKKMLGAALVALSLAGAVFAYRTASGRWDCPGKITCPLTGELICADQCPAGATADAPEVAPSCCKPRP